MLTWLHPAVVHFAVGLLFAGVLFDVIGLWRASERLLWAGAYNTGLGAVAAIVAVLTGLSAESGLGPHDGTGDALLGFHAIFGWVTTVLAVVLAVARVPMRGMIRPKFRTAYLTTAFAMVLFALIDGALGGATVYRHGLGIDPAAARRIIEATGGKVVVAPAEKP